MNWSTEQTAIFSAVASAQSKAANLIVEAVAGSGKTTTLVEACRHIPRGSSFLPPSILFLAFNKDIADTLQKRVPSGVKACTFHSLGFAALCTKFPEIRVDARKVGSYVFRKCKRENPDIRSIIRAVGLMKSVFPSPSSRGEVASLLDEVDFSSPKSLDIALDVLRQSNEDTSLCDFDDMLLLPLLYSCPFEKQDFVLVDEAQDTNDVQLEILERLQKSGGYKSEGAPFPPSPTRFLFVGDPSQAIYAFRGANADSMERITQRFSCSSLPLSVSYRCPVAVVELARKYSGPHLCRSESTPFFHSYEL